MSEQNNFESINEQPTADEIHIDEKPVKGKAKRYHNPTANVLNIVHVVMFYLAIAYGLFQCYLNVMSYLSQMAPLYLALIYTLASVLMPLMLLFSLAFLFRFFAEVIELMDKK